MASFTLVLPIVIAIAIVVIVARLGRDARVIRMSEPHAESAQRAATRVQVRNRVAVVAGLLAAVATGVLGVGIPTDLGRAALLAPAAGAGVAMLVFILVPSAEFLESDAVRRADLTHRQAWDYARVWPAYGASAAVVVLTVGLGALGGSNGRSFTHNYGTEATAASGPYPGWFYGVPIIVATVVVAALLDLALRRVARAPRPSDPTLQDADSAVRALAVRLMTGIVTSSALVSIGVILIAAGSSTMSATGGIDASLGEGTVSIPPYLPLFVTGVAELVVGIAALTAGLAMVLVAARHSARRAFQVGAAQ